jgi:hypothetical protein
MGPSMKGNLGSIMLAAMMLGGGNPYRDNSKGRYYHPSKRELDESKGILVHNVEHEHEFVIHGEKITAPNKKAAIKIYNRKFGTKKK